MNWEAIGAVAETLGAVGVIATLVYLSIQVRHSKTATEANTRQMRGQAFVSLNESMRQMLGWLRDNPNTVEVLTKANTVKWDELTSSERLSASFWNLEEAGYYELAFMLWHEGALDEQSYLSREEYFVALMLEPGRRSWWDERSFLIDERFRNRINEQLILAEKTDHRRVSERF